MGRTRQKATETLEYLHHPHPVDKCAVKRMEQHSSEEGLYVNEPYAVGNKGGNSGERTAGWVLSNGLQLLTSHKIMKV